MHFKKKVISNKVKLFKILNIRKKYNMFFFKKKFNFFFFLNKLFNSIIIKGKKNSVLNVYLKLLNILLIKKLKLKKSLYIHLYFLQIALKLLPSILYINFYSKGKTMLLPWLKKNKKVNKRKIVILGVNWLKKSFKGRKEKTFFLKFFSELENIRTGKSAALELKNNYYKGFYENRRFIRLLKKKLWI